MLAAVPGRRVTAPIVFTAGDSRKAVAIGFQAFGCSVFNASQQWLYLGNNRWAAPTGQSTFSLRGEEVTDIQWQAPPTITQPPSIAGQVAIVVYTEQALPNLPAGFGVARPAYYDRNANPQVSQYAASGIGPHGITTRWIYTVPAKRAAYIESVLCSMMRDVAPTAAAFAFVSCNYNPLGVLANGQSVALAEEISSAVGTQKAGQFTGAGFLQATDSVTGITGDTSTGGSYRYHAVMKVTEYDA